MFKAFKCPQHNKVGSLLIIHRVDRLRLASNPTIILRCRANLSRLRRSFSSLHHGTRVKSIRLLNIIHTRCFDPSSGQVETTQRFPRNWVKSSSVHTTAPCTISEHFDATKESRTKFDLRDFFILKIPLQLFAFNISTLTRCVLLCSVKRRAAKRDDRDENFDVIANVEIEGKHQSKLSPCEKVDEGEWET